MKKLTAIALALTLLCGVWAVAHAATYTFTVIDPTEEELNRILELLQEMEEGDSDDEGSLRDSVHSGG